MQQALLTGLAICSLVASSIGGTQALAQTPAPDLLVSLTDDHRLQTSVWFRCYAQHRQDAREVAARLTPQTRAGGGGTLLTELPREQRERMWQRSVEAPRRIIDGLRHALAVEEELKAGRRPRTPVLVRGAQVFELAQQHAVREAAMLVALSNESPKTAEAVARFLDEVITLSGSNASQQAACMKLVAQAMAAPQEAMHTTDTLLAILRMQPELPRTHPMYGRQNERRNAQPLSCAIGMHLVGQFLAQGRLAAARELTEQVLSSVRGSIGAANPERLHPDQLDCGYFMLMAGNLHMAGLGGPENPVYAHSMYLECQSFIDACALHSAALQLAGKVEMRHRAAVATTLSRIQNSTYPEVASRARELLARHFTQGERAQAAMSPVERGFWQFIALGAAVHTACQADEACRKRAAAMSSGSSSSEAQEREASERAKRDNAHYEGMLRAGRESVTTRGRGNIVGCYQLEALCRSPY